MATFTRLKSGSWRVQVRRKGKYVNNIFLRRKDAEEWALETERRIDRGEPSITCREARTFGDLIRLHRADLQEVGKPIGRSKCASLTFLERRRGRLRLQELDRERLIQFGKERAHEDAGPVTVGIDLGYIKAILSYAAAVHGHGFRPRAAVPEPSAALLMLWSVVRTPTRRNQFSKKPEQAINSRQDIS